MKKSILWFDERMEVVCDGRCDKAWGINNRPRVSFDVNEPDDYVFLADGEAGIAPADPGTYEGSHGKPSAVPLTDSERMNKWCSRECERSIVRQPGAEDEQPHDFSTRLYNMPWKHCRGES